MTYYSTIILSIWIINKLSRNDPWSVNTLRSSKQRSITLTQPQRITLSAVWVTLQRACFPITRSTGKLEILTVIYCLPIVSHWQKASVESLRLVSLVWELLKNYMLMIWRVARARHVNSHTCAYISRIPYARYMICLSRIFHARPKLVLRSA